MLCFDASASLNSPPPLYFYSQDNQRGSPFIFGNTVKGIEKKISVGHIEFWKVQGRFEQY